ncbi:MAG: ATP--guanido phosphotransferase, partial [Firmicutes bacterium]|nr:ATP--guanido phosphotransferase [Bacillota bacterium]
MADELPAKDRSPLLPSLDQDVVLSSRIRLARNVAETPFPGHLKEADADALLKKMQEALKTVQVPGGLHLQQLEDLPEVVRQTLVEKHLLSPAFIAEPMAFHALAIDEREQISIMINEEDHVRLQVLLPGRDLMTAWRMATQVDDELEAQITWAFAEKYGYLTACPTNIGTAMRASVMV